MSRIKGGHYRTRTSIIEADRLSVVTAKQSVRTEKTDETEISSTATMISSRTTPSPTLNTVAVVGETKTKRDLGFLNKCECESNDAIRLVYEILIFFFAFLLLFQYNIGASICK